jgi:hypothetical protein
MQGPASRRRRHIRALNLFVRFRCSQTLKQKYKVLKKVKEHHRKKRREAKKLGLKPKEPKDPGIPNAWPFKEELIAQLKAQKERAEAKERMLKEQRKLQRQQAVSNQLSSDCLLSLSRMQPVTEEGPGLLLAAVAATAASSRAQPSAAHSARPALVRRSQTAAAAAMEQDGEGPQLEALQRQALKRGRDYDKAAAKAAAAGDKEGFVDSSRRAFYKEFVKVPTLCTAPCMPLGGASAAERG